MDSLFIRTGIFLAALAGFSIAAYVRLKKAKKQPLVCPLGANCDAVIHSSYSAILGVPIELLGMLYYLGIAVAYGASFFLPVFFSGDITLLLFVAATVAEFFSLYLLYLQFAVLKEWCSWCLGSFAASTIIFILSLFMR